MHISLTFEILEKEEYNILKHVDRETFKEFRKYVINNIICTDPSEHVRICEKLD